MRERIERRPYDLLETLLTARYTKQRAGLLRQANLSLKLLRYQMRLAHDLRCLRPTGHELGPDWAQVQRRSGLQA